MLDLNFKNLRVVARNHTSGTASGRDVVGGIDGLASRCGHATGRQSLRNGILIGRIASRKDRRSKDIACVALSIRGVVAQKTRILGIEFAQGIFNPSNLIGADRTSRQSSIPILIDHKPLGIGSARLNRCIEARAKLRRRRTQELRGDILILRKRSVGTAQYLAIGDRDADAIL